VKFAFSLPPFCPDGFACHHDFAPVTRRVETRQSLLQGEMHIGNRGDHYLTTFDRNTNALISVQMRFTGDCRRQSDAEIITPPLDIEHGFGHATPLKHQMYKHQCKQMGLNGQ